MNPLHSEKTLAAFAGKILGVRNYRQAKSVFTVSDFADRATLADFLEEVRTCESDITPAGKSFLERYYGFEQAAAVISEGRPAADPLSIQAKAVQWLIELEPMATSRFIGEASGKIQPGAALRPELLPPEEI